jgi:LuxR family transcriptional regulator, quorum-sensing system regulator BjaR1
MDRFSRELSGYGFHAWLIASLPKPGERAGSLAMLNGWPQGWTQLYVQKNLLQDDPVVANCFRSTVPFEWREAPYDPLRNVKAKEVMDRAVDVGMRRGFCVPIHTSEGYQAVVTMAGERVEIGGSALRALHFMSLYAHGKAAELCTPKRTPPVRVLTEREREVLRWASVGKSSWEISQIFGIAQSTVTAHLKAAAAKLDTPNRVATVVAALRRGEISF